MPELLKKSVSLSLCALSCLSFATVPGKPAGLRKPCWESGRLASHPPVPGVPGFEVPEKPYQSVHVFMYSYTCVKECTDEMELPN